VKGEKLAAAKSAIANANCGVGTVKKKTSTTVKKGKVISQSPAKGKHLADGAKVDLVVSKGK
jgi:beta-lactam-binding protein with PASTA domain